MKALMNTKAGDPFQIKLVEVPTPSIKSNEILIKVKAASINIVDTQNYKTFYQKQKVDIQTKILDKVYIHGENKILGSDGAGIVVAIGDQVKSFQVGDEVFGISNDYLHGSWAEFMVLSEKNTALKPNGFTFEEACALPTTAGTALAAIQKAQIKTGQKVLINGASGGVGLFALQIAKAYQAEVTAVVSHYNFPLAQKFGADYLVDYHKTDVTQQGNQMYDAILGINGYHSVLAYKKILMPTGHYVAIGGVRQALEAGTIGKIFSLGREQKIGMTSLFALKNNWVVELAELANAKQLQPYLDQIFSWKDIQEAVEFAATAHLKGKVVLTISE